MLYFFERVTGHDIIVDNKLYEKLKDRW
jgi:hypothetical protein